MKTALLLLLTALSTHAAQPSFVFILVDDMGWTGTSTRMDKNRADTASDFYQTPNIDQFAQHGMRFSQAYAAAALCTPSRAGILTGKTPAELHMTTPGGSRSQSYQKLAPPRHVQEFPAAETTLPEYLKKEGYATAHFGKWHLGNQSPGQHGFDEHDGATGNETPDPSNGPKDVFGVTERALAFIKKQTRANKPFYVQLSHYAVHSPTEARDDSVAKFEKMKEGEQHTNAEYGAMTYDLDASIGQLLKEIGSLENCYIILMSDNGAPGKPRDPQNLPLNGGKGSFYEGGIRVPLIICGPSIQPNTQCDEPVTGCDLLPTLCDWAGVRTSNDLEGSSLVPLLTQKGRFDRKNKALLFHFPHYGMGPRQKPQSALIVGNYKLLKDLETGKTQLFDLKEDLSETDDISRQKNEIAQKMSALLDERLKSVDAQQPTKNSNYDPNAEQPRRRRR